jgi:exodeoxyribonuclease V alpha subunit
MPSVQPPIPALAAEPPQEPLATGRWADRLRAELLAAAQELFGSAIARERLEEATGELAERREVIVEAVEGSTSPDTDRIYLPHLAHCERELARNLKALLRAAPLRPLADERLLAEHERRAGLTLHPHQREAVLGLLSHPLALLTGGPGVGKTTIVRFVVALAEAAHARVMLASPTGRAAKRLAEATGRDAQTIHRLLGYDPSGESFLHDARNPLEADLLIVDEISMLDVVLAHHLAKAVQAPMRLILVGDPDQLPSVGPGNVLHDLLVSGVVPTYRLTQIYRQGEGSRIVANAHRILAGQEPILPERGDHKSDFYFFPADDPAQCAERLLEVVTQRIPQTFGLDWAREVQVIAPMYRGEAGVDALNERLREARAAGGAPARELTFGLRNWRVGDRVIHTRNDYDKEVFNGDMGEVSRIVDATSLLVRYPEKEVPYTGAELSYLQPAFAITVHRAQGAEFTAVVIPLVMQHYMMLQRNLLYTAVTRARKLVVLVGSPRALRMAIENAEQGQRQSALAERLQVERPAS